jgi:RNA polymerase sigma-70 factor (ECF subfamily)
MNISGHENQGAAHMSDEEAGVDASLDIPTTRPTAPVALTGDEPILEALAARDRERAASLLVEEHAKAIGRACMALLGSQSEAEDVLQETLLAALDGLESFRGDGTLRAWLLSVARRRCARRLEARGRERDLKQSLAAPEAADAAVSAERASMALRARKLLDEVRPTEREALVLRFAAELSFREVGRACGIDEAAARKRVSRGLARLRSLLGEDKS